MTHTFLACEIVSIPQAVGTIAIREKGIVFKPIGLISFNTASGRYYCNLTPVQPDHYVLHVVSIPQAVGTIAICEKVFPVQRKTR